MKDFTVPRSAGDAFGDQIGTEELFARTQLARREVESKTGMAIAARHWCTKRYSWCRSGAGAGAGASGDASAAAAAARAGGGSGAGACRTSFAFQIKHFQIRSQSDRAQNTALNFLRVAKILKQLQVEWELVCGSLIFPKYSRFEAQNWELVY